MSFLPHESLHAEENFGKETMSETQAEFLQLNPPANLLELGTPDALYRCRFSSIDKVFGVWLPIVVGLLTVMGSIALPIAYRNGHLASFNDIPARGLIFVWVGILIFGFLGLLCLLSPFRQDYRKKGNYAYAIYTKALGFYEDGRWWIYPWESMREFLGYSGRYGSAVLILDQGKKIPLSLRVPNHEELAALLERKVFDHVMPRAEAEVAEGKTVRFGPLGVNANGLTKGSRTLKWSEIERCDVRLSKDLRGSGGDIHVVRRGLGDRWFDKQLTDVPNSAVYLQLIKQFGPIWLNVKTKYQDYKPRVSALSQTLMVEPPGGDRPARWGMLLVAALMFLISGGLALNGNWEINYVRSETGFTVHQSNVLGRFAILACLSLGVFCFLVGFRSLFHTSDEE